MHWMGTGGWWGMGGMWLLWLVVIVAVVLAVVFFARSAGGAGRGASATQGESSEEILRRRYARGEIDREDYQRMLADLRR